LDSDLKAVDLDLDLDFLVSAGLGLGLGLEGSGLRLGLGLGYWWTCYKSVRHCQHPIMLFRLSLINPQTD